MTPPDRANTAATGPLGCREPIASASRQRRDDEPMEDHTRLAWAKLNAYGILLAGLAVLGAADLIDPGGTDFARLIGEVPPGQPFWTTGYVVSGVLLMYGFIRTDRRAETAGLALLTVALATQLWVAVDILGFSTFTLTRIAVLTIVTLCSWARISVLWSRHGIVVTIPARGRK